MMVETRVSLPCPQPPLSQRGPVDWRRDTNSDAKVPGAHAIGKD